MKDIRIGYGYDVHRLQLGNKLIVGGVRLEHHKGSVAYSDGDVLIHAICDSLLGALALGDIGKHFPDTAEEFRGIDSRKLLEHCVAMIEKEGYTVGNIDTMLILEKPKVAPHIEEMRSILAPLLHVEPDRVSVKATTSESLGFVGKERGIAAHSAALLVKE